MAYRQRLSRQMSQLLLPLYLKAAIRTQEPVQWKGGDIIVLAKKPGAVARCDAFRSILLEDFAGKRLHQLYRNQLSEPFRKYKHPTQGGSAAKHGVDFAAHQARIHGRL